jgi:hypothetical protein
MLVLLALLTMGIFCRAKVMGGQKGGQEEGYKTSSSNRESTSNAKRTRERAIARRRPIESSQVTRKQYAVFCNSCNGTAVAATAQVTLKQCAACGMRATCRLPAQPLRRQRTVAVRRLVTRMRQLPTHIAVKLAVRRCGLVVQVAHATGVSRRVRPVRTLTKPPARSTN